MSTCLFVWVSSFFSPLAPPGLSSLQEALTPVPLAAAGHPPSPQLVLMREWGGHTPPSPRSGIGWLRLQQEGSEERGISADRGGTVGLQPEMSLMREVKVAPARGRGGGKERLHRLSSATDPSPSCLGSLSCTEFPIPYSKLILPVLLSNPFYSRPFFTFHLPHNPPPHLIHPKPVSAVSLLPHLVC